MRHLLFNEVVCRHVSDLPGAVLHHPPVRVLGTVENRKAVVDVERERIFVGTLERIECTIHLCHVQKLDDNFKLTSN